MSLFARIKEKCRANRTSKSNLDELERRNDESKREAKRFLSLRSEHCEPLLDIVSPRQ